MSITRRMGESISVASYFGWPEVGDRHRDARGALLDLYLSELAGRAGSVRRLCAAAAGTPQGYHNQEPAHESHGAISSFSAR